MSLDRLRLIEEVRGNPVLWDFQHYTQDGHVNKRNALWDEIGQKLGVDANTCKSTWKTLRSNFFSEARRISTRITKSKELGMYDPNRKYYTWAFFDSLRFVATGRTFKAKYDPNFENGSDFEIERIVNINSDHSFNSNSIKIERAINTKNEESTNADETHSEIEDYFENDCKNNNDMEFIDNNIDHVQLQEKSYFENSFLANESENTCKILPREEKIKKEEANFKSYTISLSELTAESESTAISDSNARQHNDSVFQEDLEFHFSSKGTSAENDVIQACSSELKLSTTNSIHHEQSSSAVCAFRSPDTNDQDYSFLYSFLSQTKLMTDRQKIDFHENMKSLLLQVCPDISSARILDKQLILHDKDDPDKNFLISFWPFLKSMSVSQNLQFRFKMGGLVYEILFTETH